MGGRRWTNGQNNLAKAASNGGKSECCIGHQVSTLSRTSIRSVVFALRHRLTDRLTDAGNIDRNTPHLVHSMRHINVSEREERSASQSSTKEHCNYVAHAIVHAATLTHRVSKHVDNTQDVFKTRCKKKTRTTYTCKLMGLYATPFVNSTVKTALCFCGKWLVWIARVP